MREVEEAARWLSENKRLGVQIADRRLRHGLLVLAHLQRFPSMHTKIDRSVISGLRRNQEGETLIRTLVQLGKALSIARS
jgi:predicted signal transduction protein with EAL and GGDEF domain